MFKKIRNHLKEYKFSNLNFRIIIYVLALTAIGVITIGSATDDSSYQIKQLVGFGLGLAGMIFFMLFDHKIVFKFYWLTYALTILALLSVLVLGTSSKGAKRWIDLRVIRFQPSEFVKVLFIIFLVCYLAKHKDTLDTFKTLATITVLSLIPLGLIYKEPDLSTTIVYFVTFCVIMFLSGVHYKIIAGILIIFLPLILVVGYIVIQPESGILDKYQYDRITGFLNDSGKDSDGDRYQQENSILAIGSGGLQGKGLDNENSTSVKNGNFIAEAHTDFIFTVIGEELGFVGGASVIILLFLILLECFITGSRAPDLAGRLYCYGYGIVIGIQTFINISVATMILPNTGLTLPFVSYGLTSLLSMYCGIGILLNISLQRRKAYN